MIRVILYILLFTSLLFSFEIPDLKWSLDDALQSEYDPIFFPDIVTHENIDLALESYENGDYRRASVIFQDVLNLNVPDGNVHNISFIAAECYRELKMTSRSTDVYKEVLKKFPLSDKAAPSIFRLMQHYYSLKQHSQVDSLYMKFKASFGNHVLYNSVKYILGKSYYHANRFEDAGEVLLSIPQSSSRGLQSRFLAALANLAIDNSDKSLIILGQLKKDNRVDVNFRADINTLIGDIYGSRKNYDVALEFYFEVDKNSIRYPYSRVKTAQVYLKKRDYVKARNIARSYIGEHENGTYFFEMAAILEEAYRRMKNQEKMIRVKAMINRENANAVVTFEIGEEIALLYKAKREWYNLKYRAEELRLDKIISSADKSLKNLDNLIYKYRKMLEEIGAISDPSEEIEGLKEKRYAVLLDQQVDSLLDDLDSLQNVTIESKKLASLKKVAVDTSSKTDSLFIIYEKDSIQTAQLKVLINNLQGQQLELGEELLKYGSQADEYSREMQAKYVDWAFMRYLDKKKQIRGLVEKKNSPNTDSVNVKDSTNSPDSLDQSKTHLMNVVGLFEEINQDLLYKELYANRERLAAHMENLLAASSKSSYTPQILFRLAELYFDRASEDFIVRLEAYEKEMEASDNKGTLEFPEYELGDMLQAYKKIIDDFPEHWLADDAIFFSSLGYKKLGEEEKANEGFETLVQAYPASEYYVEANMNVGNYYFSHPKVKNNTGYTLAEEAFKRVLYFQDHPQFVQAVYHLGWCYYMEDRYDEAISVFKYLVEEVNLDFSIRANRDGGVVNPLMREEAIDYIAISFDEQGKMEEASKFLELVGSIDYAAKVIMRIGTLREEDLDYNAAVRVYQRVIGKYSNSLFAPEASLRMIKVLETSGAVDAAMEERERFFKTYSRGGKWYKLAFKEDSVFAMKNDSLAIAIGLYVADSYYSTADEKGKPELLSRAASAYDRIVNIYPNHPAAADARWNLAVILDMKLGRKKAAYKRYTEYSQLNLNDSADVEKRMQAALNAIAIAQGMMLPVSDSAAHGTLETAAVKAIEGAENYIKLFPGGKDFTKVVMSLGAVYFDRKMYEKAIESYRLVTKKGKAAKGFYNAGFYIAKCHYGSKNWPKAIAGFSKVWSETEDELQKNDALKWLLQSEYLSAESLLAAGDMENAAKAFYAMHSKYPGSKNSDIALYKSAEAYEKMAKWSRAAEVHYDLYKNYPGSSLAPEALFAGASDYEKEEKWREAANLYEIIVSDYLDHAKAKDALFNVGFCYDRLGQHEKMADANERYAKYFPGEKDVESMLLRSAVFYFKAKMYKKARTVYENFENRFPEKPRSIEALVMSGRCSIFEKDTIGAESFFSRAEGLHLRLIRSGGTGDPYFAGEAAFEVGLLKEAKFSSVSLDVPSDEVKDAKALKSAFLKEAAQAFTDVVKYKSLRMFEAGYRIGKLYDDMAMSWLKQRSGSDDPMRLAVHKKNLYTGASALIKKSFEPYNKVLELSSELEKLKKKDVLQKANNAIVKDTSTVSDTVKTVKAADTVKVDSVYQEMLEWSDSARVALGFAYIESGKMMASAIRAMQSAPIPEEIKRQPLYLFGYKKQLFETMEPMKIQVRDNWYALYEELKALNISKESEEVCLNGFAKTAYLIPNEYDLLVKDIVEESGNLPKNMDPDEREDLIFNLEDMMFEFQDKAIFGYEDAKGALEERGIHNSKWYNKIRERLARLDPDTYGKEFFIKNVFSTDEMWIYNRDKVNYWTEKDPFGGGWNQVAYLKEFKGLPTGKSGLIWGSNNEAGIYLWKNIFLNGKPEGGAIHFATAGRYKMYLNGKLLTQDTTFNKDGIKVNSVVDLKSLLSGGDNILSVAVHCPDSANRGIAISFSTLIDTVEKFKTVAMEPRVSFKKREVTIKRDSTSDISKTVDKDTVKILTLEERQAEVMSKYKSRGELKKAISLFIEKSKKVEPLIKEEEEIVKLRKADVKKLDGRISVVKAEIEFLKKKRNSLGRKK